MSTLSVGLLASLFVAATGCALTSKAEPLQVRYFSPETAAAVYSDPPGDPPRPRVLLGRFTSSANLRYRIVHRDSLVETGEYESLRWTETPEAYVRRAVAGALLGDRLELAASGGAAVLDVEVLGFEEVRRGGFRGGRVEIRYQLRDERSVFASDAIASERRATVAGFEGVILAIQEALEAASAKLAEAVAAHATR